MPLLGVRFERGEAMTESSPGVDRLNLLRAKGGVQAAAYSFLRRMFLLDAYCVVAENVSALRTDDLVVCENAQFLCIERPDQFLALPIGLREQMDDASGCGVEEAARAGGRVYAMVNNDELLVQLQIEDRVARVDTPARLRFDLGERGAFLSFLYTAPKFRRGGWATRLIKSTCVDLKARGVEVCYAHIQATNVRSLNTFSRLGWTHVARLLATPGGRYLGAFRTARGVSMEVSLCITSASRHDGP